MITKIKTILTGTFALFVLSAGFVPVTVGAADIDGAACQGAKLEFRENISDKECEFKSDPSDKGPQGRVNKLIADIINLFSVIVGIVAVIMIIYGGFRYITSGGDTTKVVDARNTILYAVVGLIIVVFAQFIVKFVLSKVTENSS